MYLLSRAYLQLLTELYRSMAPGSRLTAGLLGAAVVLSAGYLVVHQGSSPEVNLMHGVTLAAGQLPAMEAALAKANLKGYEIRGTSIFVPRGQEADYMAALVAAGALPRPFGDAQHQAVNSNTMFDLGPQRDQRMRIAKQDELAQAICKMPGIESAYVLYDVDSKPGPFKEKVITATALVKPAGDNQLDEAQVSAIRKMVAGAIAGLKPENVVVSDLNVGANGNAAKATVPAATTPSRDIPVVEPAAPEFQHEAMRWALRSWKMLGTTVSALIGLLALWLKARRQRPVAEVESAAKEPDRKLDELENSSYDRAAVIPPPHARGFFDAHNAGGSSRDELSELVADDPEAAANVLRNWIGHAD